MVIWKGGEKWVKDNGVGEGSRQKEEFVNYFESPLK